MANKWGRAGRPSAEVIRQAEESVGLMPNDHRAVYDDGFQQAQPTPDVVESNAFGSLASDLEVDTFFDKAQQVAQSLIKAQADRQVTIDEIMAVFVYPTVYCWAIPGAHGYALTIEIAQTDTVDEARRVALNYRPGCVNDDESGRSLTPLEANWIANTPPEVVRDTTAISIGYDDALRVNEKLLAENVAFAQMKATYADLGIDVFDPHEFVNRTIQNADRMIEEANKLRDARNAAMTENIEAVIDSLQGAAKKLGFTRPVPVAPQEPDYSSLTIYTTDPNIAINKAHLFPRLARANWRVGEPDADMTEDERVGMRIGLEAMDEFWRLRAGETEQKQIRAFEALIRATMG